MHAKVDETHEAEELGVSPVYGAVVGHPIPRHQIPARSMPTDVAVQLVRDELMLDGNARLNLATFVTTWMERRVGHLMAECFSKNMIDNNEHPQAAELERRCVNILAHCGTRQPLVAQKAPRPGARPPAPARACMLGGLALLWRWRARGGAARPSAKPNLVMGANGQVCWEKFCRYWQVEPRLVPMRPGRLHLTGEPAAACCDENTIGAVAVLGSTMDGRHEPVAEIAAALDAPAERTGLDIPVHVDGASGGFVAPFLTPDLAWDFLVPLVASINTSGHKYGLVCPGVGWIVWRDSAALPDDLVFKVNYLGGEMPTFALNFSRPGGQVAPSTTTSSASGSRATARCSSPASRSPRTCQASSPAWARSSCCRMAPSCPFAFRLADPESAGYTVFDLSERLRQRGWLVPAYTFPANMQDTAVLRIVVRNGFSRDLADLLLADLRTQASALAAAPQRPVPLLPEGQRSAFAH